MALGEFLGSLKHVRAVDVLPYHTMGEVKYQRLGLDYPLALTAAVIGNMVPVPFIIVYIRHIFTWLRKRSKWWDEKITRLEKKAHLKGRVVRKYSTIGLCILVAIPLPGTGAWTGALVAAVLDMRLKKAIPAIFLGVCIAAAIMTMVTFGLIHIF